MDEDNTILEIPRGDTFKFTVTYIVDEIITSLANYDMRMGIKKNENDTAALMQATATITTPSSGVGSFELTPDQTNLPSGNYFYDVRIKNRVTGEKYTIVDSERCVIKPTIVDI